MSYPMCEMCSFECPPIMTNEYLCCFCHEQTEASEINAECHVKQIIKSSVVANRMLEQTVSMFASVMSELLEIRRELERMKSHADTPQERPDRDFGEARAYSVEKQLDHDRIQKILKNPDGQKDQP